MAELDLTTYSGLKTSIGEFLGRTDLADQIPGFVTLAEAEIRRRVRRKTLRATVTLNEATFPIPADCAEVRSIRLITSQRNRDVALTQQTMIQLDERRAYLSGASGRPRFWAVSGGSILFDCAPSEATTAEIRYFEKLVPLSSTNASNSIFAEAPDLYLYGALLQSAPYLQHDERIPVWERFFEKAVSQLDMMRQNEEHAGAPQTARLPVVFP